MGYTRLQKRTEIAREIAMRRKVYPKLIARGQITKTESDHWIEIMEQIWLDYADEKDRRQKEFPFPS